MNLAIVVVLAVGAVIIGGAFTVSGTGLTWQEANQTLEDKIATLENRIYELEKPTYLDNRVNDIESDLLQLRSTIGMERPEGQAGGWVFPDTNKNGQLDCPDECFSYIPPGAGPENARAEGVSNVTVIAVSLKDPSNTKRELTDRKGSFNFTLLPGGYLIQAIGGGPDAYKYVTVEPYDITSIDIDLPYQNEITNPCDNPALRQEHQCR